MAQINERWILVGVLGAGVVVCGGLGTVDKRDSDWRQNSGQGGGCMGSIAGGGSATKTRKTETHAAATASSTAVDDDGPEAPEDDSAEDDPHHYPGAASGDGTLWLGNEEVSNRLWQATMGAPPEACATTTDIAFGAEELPATCISWRDALEFANALSVAAGLQPAYALDGDRPAWRAEANGYRLPTAEEWRAAAASAPTGAPCARGNVLDRTGADALGLPAALAFACDDHHAGPAPTAQAAGERRRGMAGNVSEWTWDAEPGTTRHRALGASWRTGPDDSDDGVALGESSRLPTVGLRLARTLDAEE